METLSYVGCLLFDKVVNTYVRKWRLLLVLNLTKYTIKENKEIKVKENIKKIPENF